MGHNINVKAEIMQLLRANRECFHGLEQAKELYRERTKDTTTNTKRMDENVITIKKF